MAVEIHGRFSPPYQAVADTLAASIGRGDDLGASVAVSVDGEMVVDIWGGWSDPERTVPWGRDTITNVWSTTKTMTNLCALMLADRGQLDLDAPVCRYWPEFAAAGKEAVLVRHVMSHTSGLSGWQEPITVEDLYDWARATGLLAAQAPWWEPGTASGYHAVTQGYLVGELVRRITGSSLGTFFREEVAGPLGADFHIGLDPAHFGRVSDVVAPPPLHLAEGAAIPEMALRTLLNPPLSAEVAWTEGWRTAEIPAANGHGNARAVALVQSVVACGGRLHGHRFLSEATCARILEQQSQGTDLVLGIPVRFGLGYGLPSAQLPISATGRACYWGGWGGSVVVVDMDSRASFAYVMNKMGDGRMGDMRGISLGLAALGGLRA